jgi:hypothetical protein
VLKDLASPADMNSDYGDAFYYYIFLLVMMACDCNLAALPQRMIDD